MTDNDAGRPEAMTLSFGPVGALMRNEVRRMATVHNVTLTEHRGLIESSYVAEGSNVAILAIQESLHNLAGRIAKMDRDDEARETARKERRRARWNLLDRFLLPAPNKG